MDVIPYGWITTPAADAPNLRYNSCSTIGWDDTTDLSKHPTPKILLCSRHKKTMRIFRERSRSTDHKGQKYISNSRAAVNFRQEAVGNKRKASGRKRSEEFTSSRSEEHTSE